MKNAPYLTISLSIIAIGVAAAMWMFSQADARPSEPSRVWSEPLGFNVVGNRVGIWTDPVTKCDYVIVTGGGTSTGVAITPRLNRDGKQVCR